MAENDLNNTYQQKRVLLHGNDDIAAAVQLLTTTVNQLTTEVNHLTTEVNQLTTQNKQLTSQNNQLTTQINHLNNDSFIGNVYIRWGRTTCPTNGTDLVYTGYAAGNLYTENGAADNLCLTSEPIWGAYDDTAQSYSAKVYGTEYEFDLYTNGGAQFFGKNLQDHDAPCAVCHTSRRATVMIPGRNQCYPGWTKEYSGYLVSTLSGYPGFLSPSNYACMDSDAEFESADYESKNGKLMYLVEAICGSLRCPPYVNYRELTCVVCSK
ncbi:short-chain collagen C4-like [Mya arenaria]|uniref:short-chain collagen C4-like n=1 Tax=Mya arenaria TaxID=6604 RepID=UPI0022E55489|nr:short-chain collagen C4-like [Mya arenaria]